MHHGLLAVALQCFACTKPGPVGGEVEAPGADTGGGTTTTGVADELDAPRFWVARDGLRAYDLDGVQVASLGEFGDRAIRLGDGRIVAIDEQLEHPSLAVLSPDGQRGPSIPLPAAIDHAACTARALAPGELERAEASGNREELPLTLAIQSSRGFAIARGQKLACINFIDRNENMASYEVSATVEFDTGALASFITLDLDERCPEREFPRACEHLEAVEVWVEGPSEPTPGEWTLSYDEDSGWLVGQGGEQLADLCPEGLRDEPGFDPGWGCATLEEVSSSGRWLLLGGSMSEGDYIHQDLVLLDRSSQEFWRVVDDESVGEAYRWERITAAELFDEPSSGYTLSVVGESEVGALPRDRFWIDGRLLIPERQTVVSIGGSLALTVSP
ncbi:hypothetical protein ENSA5_57800 [Enhygromyxa salina]|uniref:Uncharacterized protein n=1 Tax=Enhygromyxa salina TaxID=215803 RepID=A0A2S9XE79_9BACT|nr:hypothetical protein [Enhygromyxa salina]PRP91163.1 hypothetical protein ENSA5_57800 [Enhygromyxa salina]